MLWVVVELPLELVIDIPERCVVLFDYILSVTFSKEMLDETLYLSMEFLIKQTAVKLQ
jgi:hypothetical protein